MITSIDNEESSHYLILSIDSNDIFPTKTMSSLTVGLCFIIRHINLQIHISDPLKNIMMHLCRVLSAISIRDLLSVSTSLSVIFISPLHHFF